MAERTVQTKDRRRLHVFVPLLLIAGWFLAYSAHEQGGRKHEQVSIRKGVISGRVVRDHAPVSGVAVMLFGEPNFACATGADGSFKLTGVPEGNHMVAVSLNSDLARSWTDRWVPVRIGKDGAERKVDLEMIHGGVISGKVLDPAGQSITKARIAVYHREHDGGIWKEFTQLSPKGTFSLRVPSGEWLVEELPTFGASSPSSYILGWEQVKVMDDQVVEVRLRRMLQKSQA